MDRKTFHSPSIDTFLLAGTLGFAAGVILSSLCSITLLYVLSGTGAACFLLITAAITKHTRTLFITGALFLFAGVLGVWRQEVAKPDSSTFTPYVNQRVVVRGIIDHLQFRPSGQQFVLETGEGNVNVLVSTKEETHLAYGDEVEVTGKLVLPENFLTDQGTEFDYISYLYKDNILYRISYGKVVVLSHGHGSWLTARLLPVADWFQDGFNKVLRVEESDLMAGLVLGSKQNISDEFRSDLITTGTVHIIALSGYNVAIVARFLQALFAYVPFIGARGARIGGIIGIILFVCMTGAQSSAIRAGIMAVIAVLARGEGRRYMAVRALIFAGFVMIAANPKYLVYDVSFQLSFLATLGIIYLTPLFEKLFTRIPKRIVKIPIRELLATTLGAQVGTLPFILYKMGTLSIIALPANIAVLPAVPLAMGFGTLAGILGHISVSLAQPVTLVAHLLLRYITSGIQFFARVPFAAVTLKQFPLVACTALYMLLGMLVYKKQK